MSSNSSYGPVVPDGYLPPFTIVTPDDHTAWIVIAAALGLACLLFFTGIRLLVRYTISRGFEWDDYTIFAATVLAVVQSSIIFGAAAKGLGKSTALLTPDAQDEVQKMFYMSNLFLILSLGLAKISVVYFLLRISQVKQHQIAFKIAIGLMGAWTIGSILAIALQCNLAHPWITIGEDCPDMHHRWNSICAIDIVSEVAIVGLVVYLVYSLKTSRSSKAMVVSIFSFRLLIIVAIAFKIATFDQAGYTTDPFLIEAPFIAWSQSQLSYSLISATVPTFQNFLKALNTGFGGIGHSGRYGYGYIYGSNRGYGKEDGSNSYQLSKLRSAHASANRDEPENEQHAGIHDTPNDGLTPHSTGETSGLHNRSGSVAAAGDTLSIGSNGSERMMIRKNIEWTVRTEQK